MQIGCRAWQGAVGQSGSDLRARRRRQAQAGFRRFPIDPLRICERLLISATYWKHMREPPPRPGGPLHRCPDAPARLHRRGTKPTTLHHRACIPGTPRQQPYSIAASYPSSRNHIELMKGASGYCPVGQASCLSLTSQASGVWRQARCLSYGDAGSVRMRPLIKLPKSTTCFGEVGDMIVSRNRAGPYARLWVKPLDPQEVPACRLHFSCDRFRVPSVPWRVSARARGFAAANLWA